MEIVGFLTCNFPSFDFFASADEEHLLKTIDGLTISIDILATIRSIFLCLVVFDF